jgi:hypothetical protein
MDKYNLTQIGETKELFGKTQKVFQLYKKNKREITPKEIKEIYKSMITKAPANSQIRIRALGIDKFNTISWNTLKNTQDDDINIYDEEEYLQGRAIDTDKFQKFSQIEFLIRK